MKPGTVFWITGLAGAGKTTIGRLLYKEIKRRYPNTILLDGDEIQTIFDYDYGYSYEERYKSCLRCEKFTAMLARQGIHIVYCTISMYDEVRAWNRRNYPDYKEIFLNVPMKILRQRDQKGLYSGAEKGLVKNVVGIDIKAEFPTAPDLEILNDGSKTPEQIVAEILKLVD